jgi:hypothetical protein
VEIKDFHGIFFVAARTGEGVDAVFAGERAYAFLAETMQIRKRSSSLTRGGVIYPLR